MFFSYNTKLQNNRIKTYNCNESPKLFTEKKFQTISLHIQQRPGKDEEQRCYDCSCIIWRPKHANLKSNLLEYQNTLPTLMIPSAGETVSGFLSLILMGDVQLYIIQWIFVRGK